MKARYATCPPAHRIPRSVRSPFYPELIPRPRLMAGVCAVLNKIVDELIAAAAGTDVPPGASMVPARGALVIWLQVWEDRASAKTWVLLAPRAEDLRPGLSVTLSSARPGTGQGR